MLRLLRTSRWLLAGPILIGLGAFSAWPEIFECKDALGNSLYQDSPCPLKPSNHSTTPARTPDSHLNETRREVVRRPLLRKIACDSAVPGFREQSLDSRFSSPERTWQTFQRALEGANRDLAVSCLTSSARSEHEPPLRTQPREKLWELADELSVLQFKEDSGPYKIAVAPTPGGGERRITFQRLANGEWKIAAL